MVAYEGVPTGPVHQRLAEWPNTPRLASDAVALRLTGALHFLVLSGRDDELSGLYPPNPTDGFALRDAVFSAIAHHGDFIAMFLDSAPQTNETGRSAILLPAFLSLSARFGLPLVLSELGASAGLNQNWHRYRYEYGAWTWGDLSSPVTLACEWRSGQPPRDRSVEVAETAGCDIAPIPVAEAEQRLRLKSYVWPDQPTRLARLSGALEVAERHPPVVQQSGAADWLADRLSNPRRGRTHVIFHTIMWQYVPEQEQSRARALIEEAGSGARPDAPVAWLRFEADDGGEGAGLTLTTWSGENNDGQTTELARGDFHGRWIDWR